MSVEHLFDLCLQRLSYWCAALWSNVAFSTTDLISCPKNFSLFACMKDKRTVSSWIPPPSYALKFNTDGAVSGSFEDAGIGGCLRNDKSKCLILFSKSIGISNATSAEIIAISEACMLFRNLVWSNSFKLIIENNNKLVVD
ncbi:hypothetical protein GQ457_14G020070 [Hibiscus cannabinus]